jgi:hypothetical protein
VTDVSIQQAMRGLLLMFCSCAIIYCGACSATPMSRARTVVSVSAQAVVAVDRVLAPRYAAAMGAAATDPETLRRFNAVVETLLLTRSALLVSEATLDAIDAGEDHEIRGVMSCIVVAIQRLIEALPTVEVDVPEALTMALGLLGSYAGTCEPVDHGSAEGLPTMDEVIVVTE